MVRFGSTRCGAVWNAKCETPIRAHNASRNRSKWKADQVNENNYCTLSWLSIPVTRLCLCPFISVLSLHLHSLRYVRIAFLCCASFGCQHFYLFAINFFTIIYTMGFHIHRRRRRHCYCCCCYSCPCCFCWCCCGVVPAITTIIIVACLPFIHCRCHHFLFDFHLNRVHVHWRSSSVTVTVQFIYYHCCYCIQCTI